MEARVLVVCPDQEAAGLLMPVLAEMGMTVEQTPSISRGLERIGEEHFDAVVLDYHGDEACGEFLFRFRQSPKNRSAVLIAIVDAEFNARPVFGLGASFVLYRPLSLERLRLSLRAASGLMRKERRRNPRVRVNSPVNVSHPGAPELKATLADLSDGGTSITSDRRLPDSGKVYFEFALAGQQQLVRLSGEVAWQDFSGRSGIRFLDVPQASRRVIQSWLQRKASQPGEGQQESSFAAANRQETKSHSEAKSDLADNAGNRRREQRFPCTIGAEVYRVGTSTPNRCNLSDISEGGCYVEMPTPLAGESGVEIIVRTPEMKFKVQGQVLSIHPGFGMGVRFMFRDTAERGEILRLLGVLAAGPPLDEQPR